MRLTLQDTHDKIMAHLSSMESRAMDGGSCAYRTPDGKMCAIGCLISDEDYDPEFEDSGAELLPGDLLRKLVPSDMTFHGGVDYLVEMQGIHDAYWSWGEDGLNVVGLQRAAEVLREASPRAD